MRSIMCLTLIYCCVATAAAQTSSPALFDAPNSSLQNLQTINLQDYAQSRQLNFHANFKLLKPPSKSSRPISSSMFLSATLPSTVLFSFGGITNGITGTLDEFGISYLNHRPGTRNGTGLRIDPTKLCAKVFRRRK